MRKQMPHRLPLALTSLVALLLAGPALWAQREGWTEKEVHWRAGRGRRIKRVVYPPGREPPTREAQARRRPPVRRGAQPSAGTRLYTTVPAPLPLSQALEVTAPPVDGFVPWITVAATDKRKADLEFEADVEPRLVGRAPAGRNPAEDYVIGLFDTGASGTVVGYSDAQYLGLYSGQLVGPAESIVGGVVDQTVVSVSYPLGLFVNGLQGIDAQSLRLDTTQLRGESNVAVIVGQDPRGGPDLPTAVGAPLAVYYSTEIRNDTPITVQRKDLTVNGPTIRFYASDDSAAPSYPDVIPLELRPLGAISVQYIPSTDSLLGGGGDIFGDIFGGGGDLDFPPGSPSVIIGNLSQSLFFVHSVDLYDGDQQALDKDRFMLDTGAQVSVVGSRLAARLRLDPDQPDFEVEIEGVTGNSIMAPGFYVDRLEIPALGQWFVATQVPVVLLDVSSPEGGSLDGIVGMNLFVDFNLIVRGGGLWLGQEPRLELEPIAASQP